jgi:DHA1 family bicyclomycin/chloramphenicol resistance-like MFS transporter
VWLVLFFAGLILPNAPAVALSAHGETAGTAAALLGAVQFGVGAAISPLVGVLGNTALAMGTVMFGGIVLAAVVLMLVAQPWQVGQLDAGDGQPEHKRGDVDQPEAACQAEL